ncbi:4'-phosphopantetheinyl transferase superfamily protein [Pedobacter frigiditerrae]|uniref:4'-phosphopantetheinyl transferase family protein n=1 Tax=Pedobacter frigiditerrae TaxID=2530452 RepID=UPI00292FAEB3|nr:4'-phosphopantetheinyl transferase superfamily protein [Pedobacter frigiditerrae]
MLGNDIVDLKLATTQSNWRRKGYLDKLFSSQEQQEILNSSNPETMVWLFWSMKEAAYKIVNRETKERFYSPKKFNVTSYGNDGIVTFEGKTFYTKSEIKDNLIHTIAAAKAENLNHIQSSFLANADDYLSDFNSKSEHYTLEKDANGIPSIVDKTNGKSHFASVSHHGRYLSVVSDITTQ